MSSGNVIVTSLKPGFSILKKLFSAWIQVTLMHSGVIQILDWFTISHNNHVPKLCNVSCNTIYRCNPGLLDIHFFIKFLDKSKPSPRTCHFCVKYHSVSLHCLTYNQVKDDYTSASNAIAMLDMAMCKFDEYGVAKMDGAYMLRFSSLPKICNSCIDHIYLV